MKRRSLSDLDRQLDRIERSRGDGSPAAVVPSDEELEALISGEGPPAPIATDVDGVLAGVAVPDRWPASFASEFVVTLADVVDAWRELTPAEREAERAARQRRGAPIPPILEAAEGAV